MCHTRPMSETSNYIPGICNINHAEIKRRRQAGHIGLFLSAVVLVAIVAFHAPWAYRIIILLPVYVAAIGYLQARNKFCVGYAGSGKQHADEGDVETIAESSAIEADKLRARTMNLQAFIIAAVVTVIVCLIPLS